MKSILDLLNMLCEVLNLDNVDFYESKNLYIITSVIYRQCNDKNITICTK